MHSYSKKRVLFFWESQMTKRVVLLTTQCDTVESLRTNEQAVFVWSVVFKANNELPVRKKHSMYTFHRSDIYEIFFTPLSETFLNFTFAGTEIILALTVPLATGTVYMYLLCFQLCLLSAVKLWVIFMAVLQYSVFTKENHISTRSHVYREVKVPGNREHYVGVGGQLTQGLHSPRGPIRKPIRLQPMLYTFLLFKTDLKHIFLL